MQALKISEKLGDLKPAAESLRGIGAVYQNTGEYSNALKYYEQALKISRDLQDYLSEMNILSRIATVYTILNDLQNSRQIAAEIISVSSKSLELSRQIGDKLAEGVGLYNTAKVLDILA